jgi:Uma2 family endonuclease
MFPVDGHDPRTGAPTVSSSPAPWISPEQYLEAERRAETKSEYLAGQVFAMTGASLEHNRIVVNLILELGIQLRGGSCEVYPSDMRAHIPATGLYTYPDVTVVCGTPELEDEHHDTLLNPTVLIEVLSPSTERWDRGRKAEHYRGIPSLQEYLLVSQDAPRIEQYRRHGEREWVLMDAIGMEERIELASIGCALALRDVYARVF